MKFIIAVLVLLAIIAAIEARGGQTSSSFSGAGLRGSSSRSKSRAGLGVAPKRITRPAARKTPRAPPKKVQKPFRPFPFDEFLKKHAGHFTQPTRACLFSCKSSKLSLYRCARACFAQACLRRIPNLAVKCALKCSKIFGRGRCKKICSKVTTRLQLKCRRFK